MSLIGPCTKVQGPTGRVQLLVTEGSISGSMARQPRRSPASAEQAQLNKRLRAVLARLPDIERKVLECRMGLVDGEPMKPGEAADHLGLTINEMKKIEERAFSRIREVGNLKGLAKHLDTK